MASAKSSSLIRRRLFTTAVHSENPHRCPSPSSSPISCLTATFRSLASTGGKWAITLGCLVQVHPLIRSRGLGGIDGPVRLFPFLLGACPQMPVTAVCTHRSCGLNGNLDVIKSMIAELTDETQCRARVFVFADGLRHCLQDRVASYRDRKITGQIASRTRFGRIPIFPTVLRGRCLFTHIILDDGDVFGRDSRTQPYSKCPICEGQSGRSIAEYECGRAEATSAEAAAVTRASHENCHGVNAMLALFDMTAMTHPTCISDAGRARYQSACGRPDTDI
ncbi:hypothetical protein EDB87DRAFT_1579340 [Lactarius vividus]|nr:hypothetical protein EDB87DRAFT_1579340 [Lactarius vividus]